MSATIQSPSGTPALKPLSCVCIGLLITALHFGAIFAFSTPDRSLRDRYESLIGHDSYWFWNIIDHGYRSPVPPVERKQMEISNVAFFPGFPVLAETAIKGLSVSPKTGILIAAHLSTWGFWTYVLLWLRRWNFSRGMTAAAVGLILCHPGAVFTILGYSESLFLLLLLGYMFWSTQPGRWAPVIAALHGFGATATRIAGVPAVLYPVVQRWIHNAFPAGGAAARAAETGDETGRAGRPPGASSTRGVPARRPATRPARTLGLVAQPPSLEWLHGLVRPIQMFAFSLLGALSFFLFCQLKFGHWDFYMMTQRAGWGVRADYLALLKPGAYARFWPDWNIPWQVGQWLVPMTMLTLCALLWWEVRAARRGATAWRERAGLYFVGFALFFIAVSGVYSVRLESMTRYHFCTHVFLVLAALHACTRTTPAHPRTRRTVGAVLAIVAALSLLLQFRYGLIFTHGGWVA